MIMPADILVIRLHSIQTMLSIGEITTSLWLYIVCKLLAMMDSKLEVESQYAIGSTFGFNLKLRATDPEPVGKYEEKRKSVLSHEEEAHIYAPKARILVTDDNGMNLKVAINFMKIFGITPVTCSSGSERRSPVTAAAAIKASIPRCSGPKCVNVVICFFRTPQRRQIKPCKQVHIPGALDSIRRGRHDDRSGQKDHGTAPSIISRS